MGLGNEKGGREGRREGGREGEREGGREGGREGRGTLAFSSIVQYHLRKRSSLGTF
jgi:hypothetical protein